MREHPRELLPANWRQYLWVLSILGFLGIGVLLWQLPFPSSLILVCIAYTLGSVRLQVEKLEQWQKAELQIEQDLAEQARRDYTTH